MKIPKEVRVGVVAIMAIAMFVIGFNYLRGQDIFTSSNSYYGVYQKIDGLIPSNPVMINGLEVGTVTDVVMDEETRELTVEISVPSSIKVPANTVMKLVNTDMIGSKGIELIWGDTSMIATDGFTLPSQKDPGFAQVAGEIFASLTSSMDNVLDEIDSAVAGADLAQTLNDASSALRSFKETADKFNSMLDGKDVQVDRIITNVEQTTSELKALAPRITEISDKLKETSDDLSEVEIKLLVSRADSMLMEINEITRAINNSEGTLGRLVNEDSLYHQLDSTLKNLDSLMADIEAYPSRYTGITSGQRKRADKQKAKDQEAAE